MLTNLRIRNFKRFEKVDIPLGTSVVFIGPNNSGKTAALQALALWNRGLRKWQEKYRGKTAPRRRPVVTINRHDLIAIPVPRANLLWRNLRTRFGTKIDGKQGTQNVRIDIVVDGISTTANLGAAVWNLITPIEESFIVVLYGQAAMREDVDRMHCSRSGTAYESRVFASDVWAGCGRAKVGTWVG